LIVLGGCLAGSFFAGTWFAGPRGASHGPPLIEPRFEPSAAFPSVEPTGVPNTEGVDPRARVLREAIIHRDAAAIRGESDHAAGGDWDRWQRETEPHRAALKARLDELKKRAVPDDSYPEQQYEALQALDGFPLFEVGGRWHLNYLYDSQSLDGFRTDRPAVAAHRWLGRQGIDLIFVVVPKMTEVYIEHFLNPCPPDGVVAPHARRVLMDLLAAGVETVDGRSLFRPLREPAPDYLCNAYDTHWAPRGMRVMAKEIADRIARYPFGWRARYALPLFTALPGPYPGDRYMVGLNEMAGWPALTPEQQARARAAQTTNEAGLLLYNGRPAADDPKSPILLIGNSYVEHFRAQLMRELNTRIRTNWSAGMTTEAFADFIRQPESLRGVRVVVWVTTEQHMTHFKPLPGRVAAAVKDDDTGTR
jgi:hypothetical protein